MSRFNRKPSTLYVKAADMLRKLAEAEGLDAATRCYAEAMADLRLQQFASKYKPSAGHACLGRLLGKRCYQYRGGRTDVPCRLPGSDHYNLWLREGKPFLYTSEPYGLLMEDVEEMLAVCKAHGLTFDISAGSFYFPGATLLVKVRRDGEE